MQKKNSVTDQQSNRWTNEWTDQQMDRPTDGQVAIGYRVAC